MHRTTALLALFLASMFAFGCDDATALETGDADQSEGYRYGPGSLIWYDEELGVCLTQHDGGGKRVEIPCPGEDAS